MVSRRSISSLSFCFFFLSFFSLLVSIADHFEISAAAEYLLLLSPAGGRGGVGWRELPQVEKRLSPSLLSCQTTSQALEISSSACSLVSPLNLALAPTHLQLIVTIFDLSGPGQPVAGRRRVFFGSWSRLYW